MRTQHPTNLSAFFPFLLRENKWCAPQSLFSCSSSSQTVQCLVLHTVWASVNTFGTRFRCSWTAVSVFYIGVWSYPVDEQTSTFQSSAIVTHRIVYWVSSRLAVHTHLKRSWRQNNHKSRKTEANFNLRGFSTHWLVVCHRFPIAIRCRDAPSYVIFVRKKNN